VNNIIDVLTSDSNNSYRSQISVGIKAVLRNFSNKRKTMRITDSGQNDNG